MRGRIIGIDRDGLEYYLVVKSENERNLGIAMSREAMYKILEHKGYFIGKEIEYSNRSFSFTEDMKAS